jgi:4-hydroxythreonine-4-phosphate dehydrogenase
MSKFIPIIAITMGDPAGIGPEIAAKSLAAKSVYQICKPVVVGDVKVLKQAINIADVNLKVRSIDSIAQADFQPGLMNVLDLDNIQIHHLEYGKVSVNSGKAAFEYIKKAIDLALIKDVDATVTGPINKESLNRAGHHFSGHTEIYAHYTNTRHYAMLLVLGHLRVIHVSTHVSLRQACDLVKKERILKVISLLHEACQMFGITAPKIGVAGLNPHAGDGGLFGNEEMKEILPAIEQANTLGMDVVGPVPADTLFSKAKGRLYDGCVAMFHDQGHIPFKLEGFIWDEKNKRMKSVQGVNITLGLPIIRVSVDHGTAFEIAGKGIASPDALSLAINYATTMVKNKGKISLAKRNINSMRVV